MRVGSDPSQAMFDRRERAHGEDYRWAGTTG
jgi:hypothetical protein